MGGCVSFNNIETYPSESRDNDHIVSNLSSGDNWQDGNASSKRVVQIPFSTTSTLTDGSNEFASTSIGTKGAHAMVYEFLLGGIDMVFCGLFDGHGTNGDLLSRKVRDNLPFNLLSQWRSLLINEKATTHYEDSTESNMDIDVAENLPKIFVPLQHSFVDTFNMMDNYMKRYMDSFCSGSTAVTVVKKGRDLLIGNLGKSRAILGTRDTNNNLIAEQLTIDLKPNVATELDRIRRCGGRVFPTKDEPNVCRFFLPEKDAPGLGVSRAFGDICLKDYGLIADPQVSYRRLARSNEFLVLATHGVWDVLSNENVVHIVASAPCREFAAKVLVDHSIRLWRVKDPTRKTDDISAIVLYLNVEQEDLEEDPKLVYYEKSIEQMDQVSPPIVTQENAITNEESIEVEEEVLAEGIREQEGANKKKKGKSLIRIPKFIKNWGLSKNVDKSHGDYI